MRNSDTVRAIYAAFQAGDVPAILERLAEDVEWEYPPTSTHVPWLKHRVGRAAVPGFFASLAAVDIQRFDVKDLLEGEDVVVALLDVELVVRRNGRRVSETDEVHVWRFDAHGRVRRFRHGVDSHAMQVAWIG